MAPGSQQLRDALRTKVECYCDPVSRYEHGEEGHEPGCLWIRAVREVYVIEREEDSNG
jgi:hypothetical protein